MQNDLVKGIDLTKLKNDTAIIIVTSNSIYKFRKLNEKIFLAKGGRFIPNVQKVMLNGSVFGGSLIKKDWIIFNTKMEIVLENGTTLTTSSVKKAKLVGSGWEYLLDWE